MLIRRANCDSAPLADRIEHSEAVLSNVRAPDSAAPAGRIFYGCLPRPKGLGCSVSPFHGDQSRYRALALTTKKVAALQEYRCRRRERPSTFHFSLFTSHSSAYRER
jgi:hypothetical protein